MAEQCERINCYIHTEMKGSRIEFQWWFGIFLHSYFKFSCVIVHRGAHFAIRKESLWLSSDLSTFQKALPLVSSPTNYYCKYEILLFGLLRNIICL